VCCRIVKVYSTALKNTSQLGRLHEAKPNRNLVLLRYMSACMHRDKKYSKLGKNTRKQNYSRIFVKLYKV